MINFSSILLGKDLNDLEYSDIENFFSEEREESNDIEFKGFTTQGGNTFLKSIVGINRAVCALLNSDGGIVIWGAPIGIPITGTNKKKFVGALSPVNEVKDKDWIINKVSDSISPLPVGIRVKILQNATSECVYVFEVQSSPYKPHQTDSTYVVRLDGQTKPAPHYLVEALFRRISYPNIEGFIKFNSAKLDNSFMQSVYFLDYTLFLFNFSRVQNEENITYRLVVHPGRFQSRMQSDSPGTYEGKEGLLHFGAPMMNSGRIVISDQELRATNNLVTLALVIGGKKSPAKSSVYKLNLQNVNLSDPKDTAGLIVSMEENQLLSEKQDQLGSSREDTLRLILGREPSTNEN